MGPDHPETLLIRADSSTEIGAGHVMRCLALSEAWQAEGGDTVLVGRLSHGTLQKRLLSKGIRFIPLEDGENDIDRALGILDHEAVSWVVLDGYHFDTAYQRRVRRPGVRLLVIDDVAQLSQYHADLLLNQNIGAGQLAYACEAGTKLLLGPHYALLRPEFALRRMAPRRQGEPGRRLLVTLGGSDPANITGTVVRALLPLKYELEVTIVVGSDNLHRQALQSEVAEIGGGFRLLVEPEVMAALMADADLAVAAGGITSWELAFMGLPSLVITAAQNQRGNAEGLAAAGIAVDLGWYADLSEERLCDAVTSALRDEAWRLRASELGRRLVDGAGARRVVQAMRSAAMPFDVSRLHIRPAGLEDVVPLWQLAMDREVRAHAFRSESIPFDRHVAWLAKKLEATNSRIWLMELDGTVVGQVRYDRCPDDVAEIDFAIARELRGRGLGTRLLRLTAEPACSALGVARLRAFALESNPSSKRAFLKAGFSVVAENQPVHGRACSVFEWDSAMRGGG